MKKKKILFTTLGGADMEAGFAYAVELAGTLDKDIAILVAVEKKTSIEDVFAAAAFAEVSGYETAREILRGGEAKAEDAVARLRRAITRSRLAGTAVDISVAEGGIPSVINARIAADPDVELVLLGPSVAEAGTTARTLKKLVSAIPRPVVTMTRQSLAG